MSIHETLVSFPAERRADGCFYGDQRYWVRWDRDESGAVRLLSVPCESYPGADLLSCFSDDKRAETVRQINEKEAARLATSV